MTTLNLQVNASGNDGRQKDSANDIGRVVTANGLCSITELVLSPGSHASGDEWSIGARFLSVTIPQGATINSATFTMTPQATYNAGANVISYHVSAQAADNAAIFTASSGNLNTTNRPRSTAVAGPWVQTSVTANVAQAISVTTLVQEIVNRAGWASGNALVILVDTHANTTAGEWQDYYAYDGTPASAPKLDIDYGSGTKAPPIMHRPLRLWRKRR